ncbi:MAG: CRISPR system precrRNA processing endoribonuclease RAMP protein Cas6 [candidate division WOR-3 bacterium]
MRPRIKCDSCLLLEQCAYFYLFETPPNPEKPGTRKYPYYPHPYVIEPPLDGESFRIILLGKGTQFFNNLLLAVERMGQNGLGRERFRFSPVVFSGGFQVYKDGVITAKPIIMSIGDYIAARMRPKGKWAISFKTPTRIVHNGSLMKRFSPEGVISSLIRRLSLLIRIHEEPRVNLGLPPTEELLEGLNVLRDETHPVQHESFSGRQRKRLRLQGFMGDVVLSGGSRELWDLLIAGEIIHVGKGTSFGFGTYRIEEV